MRATELPHQRGLSFIYIRGQSLVMCEEPIPKDETTRSQWDITAIPYKYNYALFSCRRWARQKTPVKRKLDVELNLTDRTIFLISFTQHRFLILAPKLTIAAHGQFFAAEDMS